MMNAMATAPNATMAAPHDLRQEKLKRTCSEFESLFITHMLKSMRSAVTEDGLLGNSNESRIVRSMFDENLALAMAEGKGMGLGKMLFESLKD
jgi:flagellar protein FlgJ